MNKISLEEAIEKVKPVYGKGRTVTVRTENAQGRILARPVYASADQPPFRRSAMDGYGVCGDIIPGKEYPVLFEIDAGDTNKYSVPDEAVIRIMTGAACPVNVTKVIPQEMSNYGEKTVVFSENPLRDNISPAGEDFSKGDMIAAEGIVIDAAAAACICSSGAEKVTVYEHIKAAIISTGNELRYPGEALEYGQIYNSNLMYIRARLAELGCEEAFHIHVRDNAEEISGALLAGAENADIIITTGGVSVGKRDLLEEAVKMAGGEVLFHGIRIKPGAPTMYSVLNDIPVLSLSGNPFAARCMFEMLNPFKRPVETEAVLKNEIKKERPLKRLVPGIWDGMQVTLSDSDRSGSTLGSVGSNCIVELPEGKEALKPGTRVRIYLILK